jgi:hypothetical protein
MLYTFTGGADGEYPYGTLVYNRGTLYGIAAGGQFNYGIIFQYVP